MKSTKRRPWTAADIKLLRQLAKQGQPARTIARQLKRSVRAVYQYGSASKIRFLGASKSKAKRKK
jgi:DNA invertase Pin-like site-specific DNA recombinase